MPNLTHRPDGQFHVTTRCTNGAGGCVAVGWLDADVVAVQDTKRPDAAPHVFTERQWREFIAGVRAGEFDVV